MVQVLTLPNGAEADPENSGDESDPPHFVAEAGTPISGA